MQLSQLWILVMLVAFKSIFNNLAISVRVDIGVKASRYHFDIDVFYVADHCQ